MLRYFDRVRETSTTTGTGDFTLAGAVSQFTAFSSRFAVGDTHIPYAIVGQTGTEWEVGIGTYSASNTLARDKILRSSNSDAVVNFSASTKDVFVADIGDIVQDSGNIAAISRGLAMP
jgi:hypothetical protein